jgi:AsmA protein
MRAVKIAGSAIAAVIVVAALLLIVGVPSGFLTSAIQSRVERATGYRLTIAGTTRIGLWPSLNVTLNDVTLEAPKDRDGMGSLTVGRLQADITLASLWSGHPQVTELAIAHPVLHVPLLRERGPLNPPAKAAAPAGEADADAPVIDLISVTDGVVEFSNLRDRVANRIEGINVDAVIGGDRKIRITGNATAGEQALKFDIGAIAPAHLADRQNIPVDLKLEAPGALQAPLSAKAEVRLNGALVMINGLSGTLGDGAFNGWASVDTSSKPLVKLDLDFQRLDVAASAPRAASSPSQGLQRAWSNASIDLTGLNYVDAQIRVSAAELNIGEAHIAPAAIDATLAGGVVNARFANLGAYGGQASGDVIVDASAASPTFSLRSDLSGVRALPLLRSVADFDKLDGKLQAKLALRSAGPSQRAIMSNLDGSVFVVFQDGAIRGLNVAQMVRSLTASTLSGWQEGKEQSTDLTQLSASFRIEKGQATTTDLNLVGPLVRMTGAGTIDLGTQMLAFRVEPKLVMTTQGQGRAADPVGLGIPVVIDGPWAEPRIYPDMAGILDNPDAAYAKLKDMGKGLFGPGGAGLGGGLGGLSGLGGLMNSGQGTGQSSNGGGTSSGGKPPDALGGQLGETIGNLLQQGLGQGRNMPAAPAAPAAQAPAGMPALPAAPQASDTSIPPPSQDSQPMKDVLKQLFNR